MKRLPILVCLVSFLHIFGAELCAAPVLDFEEPQFLLGMQYGDNFGNHPGDVILTTPDGIQLSVAEFYIGSATDFYQAVVGGRFTKFTDTTPLELDNISIVVDYSGLGYDVTGVTFDFQEFGGWINLSINGQTPLQARTFSDLPNLITPDFQASVVGNQLLIESINNRAIEQLGIGGQELVVDNIVAIPEPGASFLVAFGLLLVSFKRQRLAKQRA